MKKHTLIAGGKGFIGRALAPALARVGHQVSVVSRDHHKSPFQDDIKIISWNGLDQLSPPITHIVNLCGENIGTQRWSDSRKETLIHSRINPTKRLIEHFEDQDQLPTLLNASAIGIYGAKASQAICDENTPIAYSDFPDFSSELTKRWEKSALAYPGRTILMRFGVVLDPGGGALQKLLPAAKLGLNAVLGSGEQIFTWVSRDDVVRAIHYLISQDDMDGPVNITSPNPVSQALFAKTLSRTLKRPCFMKLPNKVISKLFGQMGEELLLGGKPVLPMKLQDHGFEFHDTNIDKTLFRQLG